MLCERVVSLYQGHDTNTEIHEMTRMERTVRKRPARRKNKRSAEENATAAVASGITTRVLGPLRGDLSEFPKALARIAKYVLANPEKVVHESVGDLAAYSKAGQASVVRLCRTLGFEGFRDFKLALMADLTRRPIDKSSELGADHAAIERMQRGMLISVQDICDKMDGRKLIAITNRLMKSRRTDIYGSGASGIAGEIMAYRLLRLGLVALAFRDATMAHEVANGLDVQLAAVAVSASGISPDTVQFLQNARRSGAYTLAITERPNSPVTKYADHVLLSATIDPLVNGVGLAMAPLMFLIETLCSLVAQRSIVDKTSKS